MRGMPGKIPKAFIDQVIARTDLVELIDRRVPLTRKGKEYAACCPFHEEKTPSFTVSPAKQFYHCFGCGAHGTAIGFLMEHGNLSFREAIEELAGAAGLRVPDSGAPAAPSAPGESPNELLEVVAEANRWFQAQLRAPEGREAIAYLKARGLDGRTAAEFGIGYAPPGWDNLARALGGSELRRRQLQRAGLLAQSDKAAASPSSHAGLHVADAAPQTSPGYAARVYDRFRGRVMFPIEDRRGRVVAFGGRVIGDDEPKYLNSPETPLFHKGAEVYGLHRARQAAGRAGRVLLVEGYLDVIALAQFGIDNAVATLGTATTRAHLQRLFQAAPEIVFCFDGDRAGRDAAWRAMENALPELRDGRQIGFLFLPDGEDPDSMVRAEGADGFTERAANAQPLPEFLFKTLCAQVDLKRLDGKARLVELAKPLLAQLPAGALREMMRERLAKLCELDAARLGLDQLPKSPSSLPRARQPLRRAPGGQPSPLALAVSMLLQHPQLAARVAPGNANANGRDLHDLHMPGAETLRALVEKITGDAQTTTARLLEHFRGDEKTHAYLAQLAARENHIDLDVLEKQFDDTIARLREDEVKRRRAEKIGEYQRGLPPQETGRALREIKEMFEAGA